MTHNTQDKNQSAEERSQDTRRFVPPGQISDSQEIHRRREDPYNPRRAFVARPQSTNCACAKASNPITSTRGPKSSWKQASSV